MRLLLVEDDSTLRAQLRAGLQEAGYVVDEADNGRDAHFQGDIETYDAVVLDLGLPLLDGLSVLKRWRDAGRTMPVLILTARDNWNEKVAGIDAGADDYLAKPFELAELTARMRAVVRRGSSARGGSLAFGQLSLDVGGRLALLAGQPLTLSAREWDLLVGLVEADGKTVPKERLLADGSTNALEVHVCRLRPRLEAAGLRIRTVRGFGYRLEIADAAVPDAP